MAEVRLRLHSQVKKDPDQDILDLDQVVNLADSFQVEDPEQGTPVNLVDSFQERDPDIQDQDQAVNLAASFQGIDQDILDQDQAVSLEVNLVDNFQVEDPEQGILVNLADNFQERDQDQEDQVVNPVDSFQVEDQVVFQVDQEDQVDQVDMDQVGMEMMERTMKETTQQYLANLVKIILCTLIFLKLASAVIRSNSLDITLMSILNAKSSTYVTIIKRTTSCVLTELYSIKSISFVCGGISLTAIQHPACII